MSEGHAWLEYDNATRKKPVTGAGKWLFLPVPAPGEEQVAGMAFAERRTRRRKEHGTNLAQSRPGFVVKKGLLWGVCESTIVA